MSYPARGSASPGIDGQAIAACRRRANPRITAMSCRGGRADPAPAHAPPPLSRGTGTQRPLARAGHRLGTPAQPAADGCSSRAAATALARALSVGAAAGAHLRSFAVTLQPVRQRDARHCLRHRAPGDPFHPSLPGASPPPRREPAPDSDPGWPRRAAGRCGSRPPSLTGMTSQHPHLSMCSTSG